MMVKGKALDVEARLSKNHHVTKKEANTVHFSPSNSFPVEKLARVRPTKNVEGKSLTVTLVQQMKTLYSFIKEQFIKEHTKNFLAPHGTKAHNLIGAS